MKSLRKALIAVFTAALTLALAFSLVACGGKTDNPTPNPQPKPAKITGSYAKWLPEYGDGIGLIVNLYEDGTFYFNQFTSAVYKGKYTSETATGTDEQNRTKLAKITFTEGNVFGDVEKFIVKDSEGAVSITGIFDARSNATYELSLQKEAIAEQAVVIATYWSSDYANDAVKLVLNSDDTYALDGINGLGEAGSLGSFTVTEKDGVKTYSLTDGDDANVKFTLTVGETVTLAKGEKTYTLINYDPTAAAVVEFIGTKDGWLTVTIQCFDGGVCVVKVSAMENVFTDGEGTWSYVAEHDMYYVAINGMDPFMPTATDGIYSINYTVQNAALAGNTVTVTYTKAA